MTHRIWRGQQLATHVRVAARRARIERELNTCPVHPHHPRACFLCVYGSLAGRFVPTVDQIMRRALDR
jgi:hypothetical protein